MLSVPKGDLDEGWNLITQSGILTGAPEKAGLFLGCNRTFTEMTKEIELRLPDGTKQTETRTFRICIYDMHLIYCLYIYDLHQIACLCFNMIDPRWQNSALSNYLPRRLGTKIPHDAPDTNKTIVEHKHSKQNNLGDPKLLLPTQSANCTNLKLRPPCRIMSNVDDGVQQFPWQ